MARGSVASFSFYSLATSSDCAASAGVRVGPELDRPEVGPWADGAVVAALVGLVVQKPAVPAVVGAGGVERTAPTGW